MHVEVPAAKQLKMLPSRMLLHTAVLLSCYQQTPTPLPIYVLLVLLQLLLLPPAPFSLLT